MLAKTLCYGCLLALCSLSLAATNQVADSHVTSTITFYEVQADGSRGMLLSTLKAVDACRYRWERRQFVSLHNEYYLPHRRQLLIKLTIVDEQQARLLDINKLELIPAQRFRALGNHEYLFTPNELDMQEERIGLCFVYNGQTYMTKLQLQWQRAPRMTDYQYETPVVRSRPTPTQGYGIQLVALRHAPDMQQYQRFRKYGAVHIVQEDQWFKVQVGSFDRYTDAVAALRQIKRREGVQRAFIQDYSRTTADRPIGYGYDPYGAPRFTPTVGYTIRIASFQQVPLAYQFGQLAEHDLYYKREGNKYQVQLGSFPNLEKATAALPWIRTIYPRAVIAWEDAQGAATLLRASSWASARKDHRPAGLR